MQVDEENPQPAVRTPSVLQVAVAFAGRGALWGLLVVVVIGALSGFFGIVWLGLVPGVFGGALAGFTTGAGAAFAARFSGRRRYLLAGLGGAVGAAVPLMAAWVSLRLDVGFLPAVGVVAVLAGLLAPFALLRSDGVRRDRSRNPWLLAGVAVGVAALVLCSVRGPGAEGDVAPTWALASAAAAALVSAASVVVGLIRRDRAHPEPRVSESDGIWAVVALGMVVLGLASIAALIQVGVPAVGS